MWRLPRERHGHAGPPALLRVTCRAVRGSASSSSPGSTRSTRRRRRRATTCWSSPTAGCSSGSPGSRSSTARNVGRVWSFRDITETRRAEERAREQLLESERSARAEAERASSMKDEFLATLSHELRTPLSAILGWSHILRSRTHERGGARTQGLEVIERNARVQTQLIEDLLDMSRITSGKMRLDVQPVEPATVHRGRDRDGAARGRGQGHPARASCSTPRPGPVIGDPNRLQQVVWNLLSNAIKFTPQGRHAFRSLLERVNSHIEITVADTGIGIKPEFLPHVFERFRQADASTTRTVQRPGPGPLDRQAPGRAARRHGAGRRARARARARPSPCSLPLTVVHSRREHGERMHPRALGGLATDFKRADLSGLKVLVVDDRAGRARSDPAGARRNATPRCSRPARPRRRCGAVETRTAATFW